MGKFKSISKRHQNLVNVAKAVVREKCVTSNAYVRRGNAFIVNNLFPS